MMRRISVRIFAVTLIVLAPLATAGATTSLVPAGGDLQGALNSAQPGDTILLEPGATYIGNFTLPTKPGATFITVETSPDGLPGDGVRVSPAQSASLAKLRSPNGAPALGTLPGAHHWRIVLVEFLANRGGEGDVIALGDGSSAQNSVAQVPHDLVVDRCYVHADPGSPQKRGISLNSASTTVTASYIAEIKSNVQDSQAIAGWNGPGPFTITNNYLEAAGENVLFGGADPAIPNLVPSDITITGNTIMKQLAWRTASWTVKNLLELKNARRVTIRSNTLEYIWEAAQSGFAILLTVRNQDGGCPWCQVEQVSFENNVVRHGAAGVSILGFDDTHPSQQTRSITIRNNVFSDIDDQNWGGTGYFLMLLGGARDVTVDHNTIISEHASGIITVDGPQVLGFSFTNNVARQNDYGIAGTNHRPGNDTIAAFLPQALIVANAMADANAGQYPAGNTFPSSETFRAQFASYAFGDYTLVPTSIWLRAGTDGLDLGAGLTTHPRPVPPTGLRIAPQ